MNLEVTQVGGPSSLSQENTTKLTETKSQQPTK